MRIATVDSACSVLNESFAPTNILSMVGIVVDHPYEQPSKVQVRGEEYLLGDPNLLVDELKLCQEMLETEQVDSIHLDMSLGGVNILEITQADLLFKIPISPTGREVLKTILPELQRIATAIDEQHHVPVLAIGKRSGPVRLAELHAAAYGVAKAIEKAKESGETVYVGLPVGTTAVFNGSKVTVTSLIPIESKMRAEAPVSDGVQVESFLNPIIRRFHALKITPGEAVESDESV